MIPIIRLNGETKELYCDCGHTFDHEEMVTEDHGYADYQGPTEDFNWDREWVRELCPECSCCYRDMGEYDDDVEGIYEKDEDDEDDAIFVCGNCAKQHVGDEQAAVDCCVVVL